MLDLRIKHLSPGATSPYFPKWLSASRIVYIIPIRLMRISLVSGSWTSSASTANDSQYISTSSKKVGYRTIFKEGVVAGNSSIGYDDVDEPGGRFRACKLKGSLLLVPGGNIAFDIVNPGRIRQQDVKVVAYSNTLTSCSFRWAVSDQR